MTHVIVAPDHLGKPVDRRAIVVRARLTVCADLNNPLVVEPEVLGAMPFPGPETEAGLVVQATAWQRGDVLRYVVAVTNFSSATVDSLYLLDRYFNDDPELGEMVHDWFIDPLEPGQSAVMTFEYPDGAWAGGLPPDRVWAWPRGWASSSWIAASRTPPPSGISL